MRDKIKLELTLLQADELRIFIAASIEKTRQMVIERGQAKPHEARILKVFPQIFHKIDITEEESEHVDKIIESQDKHFNERTNN